MARKGFQSKLKAIAGLAFGVMLCLVVSRVGAAEVHHFANGISATIYLPEEILGQMKSAESDEGIELLTPNGVVELTGDVNEFYPFDFTYVQRALAGMRNLNTTVDVNVYVLPAIPLGAGGSFARQDGIYLAPGIGLVDETTVAYITTHEMGHVLTWAFLDDHPARWQAYLDLRGLNLLDNGPLAIHADRAREILAEDIRFLFGSPESVVSGSIENHDLALPTRVDGLQALLSGFFQDSSRAAVAVTSSAFPNPCNPLTTIAMSVPAGSLVDGGQAVLRIFDIRGALVRNIAGGNLANNRITVQWNGSTDHGNVAASGRYLYVMQVGELVARGAVTLVR